MKTLVDKTAERLTNDKDFSAPPPESKAWVDIRGGRLNRKPLPGDRHQITHNDLGDQKQARSCLNWAIIVLVLLAGFVISVAWLGW